MDKENLIESCTIPYTSITISKVKEGERAGEFLFSAKTVDNLGEFYDLAKHLPYKPGALVGIHDEFEGLSLWLRRRAMW